MRQAKSKKTDDSAMASEVDNAVKVDAVNHPAHYTKHPSGVECIDIAEHFNFCLGNTIKYLWRAGDKGCKIEDLKKGAWYLNREIARLESERSGK